MDKAGATLSSCKVNNVSNASNASYATSSGTAGSSTTAKYLSLQYAGYYSGNTGSSGTYEPSSGEYISYSGLYFIIVKLGSYDNATTAFINITRSSYGGSGYSGLISTSSVTSPVYLYIYNAPSDFSNNGGISVVNYNGTKRSNQYFYIEFYRIGY